jgi:predicted GNAT superfamily acetyltransferase
MHASNLQIRLLTSANELKQVRDLEVQIWDGDDPIPVHQTATAAKHGGLILGAFDKERLIGFQYSFAGFNGQKVYLCSHTLGIESAYRNSGIGTKLKWQQRTEAIKKGYDLITWTYDPLETANGYLNIGKLGARCRNYLPHFYGEMTDALNEGLPSDRFMVKWWIKSDSVAQKAQLQQSKSQVKENISLIHTFIDKRGLPVPQSIDLNRTNAKNSSFLVPIPAAFQQLKKQDPMLANQWRLLTKKVFSHYFAHGFEVDDFIKNEGANSILHYYVLSK